MTNLYSSSSVDIILGDLQDCCSQQINLAFSLRNNVWHIQGLCSHGWYTVETSNVDNLTDGILKLYNKVAETHKNLEE